MRKSTVAAMGLALLLAGCGGGGDDEVTLPATESSPTAAQEPAPQPEEPEADPAVVSRAELGDDWPLTVEEGVLGCQDDAAYIDADGRRWALNGVADSRGVGVDIDPIWAPNPEIEGAKKSIGGLISRALELCDD